MSAFGAAILIASLVMGGVYLVWLVNNARKGL
jgi:hypothetical protein